jgi:glycosyltransferase involved in cell wall biosynthesis
MPEETLLSAIVPVHKMAGRLEKLILWLSDPIVKKIEVIIVHDKGDQSTEEELKIAIAQSPNRSIKFQTGIWSSPGYARNAGLELATGKFIAFWDSDDIPDVANILACLQEIQSDIDLVIGQYKIIDSQSLNSVEEITNHLTLIDVAFNPGIWRFIFKRSIIGDNLFEKEKMGEDQEFISNCLVLNPRIAYSNSIFYNYFTNNPNQLTNNKASISNLKTLIIRSISSVDSKSMEYELPIRIMQTRQIITYTKQHVASGIILIFKYYLTIISVRKIIGIKKLYISNKIILKKKIIGVE